MKLKIIRYYLAIIVFFTSQLWATNTNPVVTNVTFSSSGTIVTVNYDVTDAQQSTVTISMEVSSDNGVTWNYNYGIASGNIGSNVPIGTGKTITFTYNGGYNDQFKIKIIADDLVGDQIYYTGKIYNTVTIGSQVWLKENLDVGTRINGSLEQTNNGTIEKYCYNDDPSNCTTYGGLYQWAEAVQYQNGATNTTSPSPAFSGNIQGICPQGWHLPTYAELQTLSTTVNNDGNVLKAIGQDGTSTNISGFTALLAGGRSKDGSFGGLWSITSFWSSTEIYTIYAYPMPLMKNTSNIDQYFDYKATGYSVRCVKDN